MKTRIGGNGYCQLTLCDGAKRKQALVHHLVAAAFIGPRPIGMIVCHRNGIKKDCKSDNLYYGTHKQNAEDSIRHGHQVRGENQGSAKLTEANIREIRSLSGKLGQRKIAKKFGVCQSTIGFITRREIWRHVQ